MADLEERLIGFQIIQCVNRCVECILEAAATLQGFSEQTTVTEIQEEVLRAIEFLNQELTKLIGFVGYFPQQSKIDVALNWLNTLRSQLDDDGANLLAILDNLQTNLLSQNNLVKLAKFGEDIVAYLEQNITETADIATHYTPDHMYVATWDLAEATGYVLQGKSAETGNDGVYATVEERKIKAEKHLKTFNRLFGQALGVPGVQTLITAMATASSDIDAATTTAELDMIGQTLLASIPSIPLLRRHWKYGS